MFKNLPLHKSSGINFSLLILRFVSGAFMLTHGYGKMVQLFNGDFSFADPIGIGPEISLALTVFAEVLCAFLVLIGLATRFALIPLLITMIVAVFIVHASHDFGKQELGLFYLASYLVIFICGPGKYSIDAMIYKK